ncbi:MAG: hypothetical protein QNJ33_12760, partial [Crocosphaera sp.]|nr:hypothetical protein [Crocosphaera sp.]
VSLEFQGNIPSKRSPNLTGLKGLWGEGFSPPQIMSHYRCIMPFLTVADYCTLIRAGHYTLKPPSNRG